MTLTKRCSGVGLSLVAWLLVVYIGVGRHVR
jgi:hypothetical protein